jgi:RimJ/RimL family protein N-acetyltransferase
VPGQDQRAGRRDAAALSLPDPPLRDANVALRAWRADDVPDRLMAVADPLVQRFSWARTTPYTEADARMFFAAQEQARLRGEEISFALVVPDDDADVLGGASLYGVDRAERRAAVGYWLAERARGRGVATSAVRLIAGWAFAELGLCRLELTCAPENAASQRVAERCGFTREGVLRSYMEFKGARRDTVVFSLLAEELGSAHQGQPTPGAGARAVST